MSVAGQYASYVERVLLDAILTGFREDKDAGLVQVAPAPWQDHVHAVIYVLGEQQRIYL